MNSAKIHKPVLIVTMGDPAGIGPEIIVKALSHGSVYRISRPFLAGNVKILEKAVELVNTDLKFRAVHHAAEARFRKSEVEVMDIPVDDPEKIEYGKVSEKAGDVAFKSIRKSIDMALAKEVDGIVTCPVHKEAIHKAGYNFPGHTEIFAHYTNSQKYGMMLACERVRVMHVSTHVSLRQACDLVKKQRIVDVIDLLNGGLHQLGYHKPRIGVAGLNPHSGDGGLFGDEEEKEIIPAIKQARLAGMDVQGPVPPDILFAMAKEGHFDGCVAMYHDQGHIPFKMLGFTWDEKTKTMKSVRGVNITLGLPVIRTSVDHGTAFDIAGKGVASPDALLNAIEYAVRMKRGKE
jgi:4-hydroxythreonine-4-phosphate dehydrogenase